LTSVSRGPLQQILDANPNRIADRPTRKPDKEFLILFTARTASSHLAELLTSARVGDVREWLNPEFVRGQADGLRAGNLAEYLLRIRSHCPEGVFGQKMTIAFYEAFSREVRLEDFFNFGAPTVLLFRDNIIEQAVSLYLANQRKHFHKLADVETLDLGPISYDASEISRYAEALCREEERLKSFIDDKASQPRFLDYEALVDADPTTFVRAVADMVSIAPALDRMKSRHLKLGNADNEAMAERFIEENLIFCDGLHARRHWLFEGLEQHPLLQP
jgi:LPS sulfotransferase NodH